MTRTSTLVLLATLFASTAMAGPKSDRGGPDNKPDVEAPAETTEPTEEEQTAPEADETEEPPVETAPTEDVPTEDAVERMPFGQWVKAQREAGLSGQALADAIEAEREARRGLAPDEASRRKANKAVARDRGGKKR